jgi:hypothetical protein
MSQMRSAFHFRHEQTVRTLVLLFASPVVACAGGSLQTAASDGASPGAVSEAGVPEAGVPEAGARLSRDASSLTSEGGSSCASSLDVQGCSCTPGMPPRECYPGPKSQAGVGACNQGTQSCISSGSQEFASGQWGPCQGAGQPGTCASEAAQCGTVSDGCGGVLACGDCSSVPTAGGTQGSLTCGAGGTPNVCAPGSCLAKTCAEQGATCGTLSDGCQSTLDCGSCAAPQTCGGGGTANQCGCIPSTCSALGAACGSVSDGCNGTLDCGSCTAPQTCGGGGTADQCGCTPTTCSALGATCGTPSDGCGGTLSCGGACTCGPLQEGAGGINALVDSMDSITANTPAACQAWCNSLGDVYCCLLFAPAVCYASTSPSCLSNFAPAPDGGDWWGSTCR